MKHKFNLNTFVGNIKELSIIYASRITDYVSRVLLRLMKR